MYKAEQKEISADGESISVWGVSDENGFILDFTAERKIAEDFAGFLNENDVERQQVMAVAEDMFYS